MKNLFILILMLSGSICFAQTIQTEQIEVAKNKKIQLKFDEATLVHVSEWDGNYISIESKVSINDNTQNDAYAIETNKSDGSQVITGYVKNKKDLPRIIRIKKGDEIFTFQTDDWDHPEIKQFYKEHGKEGISWKSHGLSWEIDLVVKIPKGCDINVTSKHGMIELENISANLVANSTHGGIDLSVNSSMKSELIARTKWGNIYSNLDLKMNEEASSNRDWNHIVANVNGGSRQSITLESKHANIYLRKK